MKKTGFVGTLLLGGKLFVLNLLWLVTSLPFFTIGASTCALCYVSLKLLDDQEGNIFTWYFKSFKENLKQGTIMWFFTFPAFYGVYLCWKTVFVEELGFIAKIGALIYTLIMLLVVIYAFPVISHYKNTFKKLVKSAFGISIQFFSKTILLILIVALYIFLWGFNYGTMVIGSFIFPVAIFFTICARVNPIFKQLEKKAGKSE